MSGLLSRFYHSRLLGRIFHTLLFCLQRELEDCKTVLDIGCGLDSPLQYCRNIKYSVGVEPFLPYLNESKKKKIHTKYLNKRAEELDFPDNSFDAVIMIEVLEHLPRKAGEEVLRKIEKWARKKIIISTPNGFFPMSGVDNSPWQKHLSGWNVKDFRSLGFNCRGLAGIKFFYNKENEVNGWMIEGDENAYTNIRFRPKKLFYLLNALFQIFAYYFPIFSFELLAVKKLK